MLYRLYSTEIDNFVYVDTQASLSETRHISGPGLGWVGDEWMADFYIALPHLIPDWLLVPLGKNKIKQFYWLLSRRSLYVIRASISTTLRSWKVVTWSWNLLIGRVWEVKYVIDLLFPKPVALSTLFGYLYGSERFSRSTRQQYCLSLVPLRKKLPRNTSRNISSTIRDE
jgi:hypothetical protein